MIKTLLVSMAALVSASAFAGEDYRLATVDSIEFLPNESVKLTYTLPCQSVDFENIVAAYDDSGDQEVRVGVVYRCDRGRMKKFEKIVIPGPNDALAAEGTPIVPMKVRSY